MSRDPEVLSAHLHSENGIQSIRLTIVYRGLKGEPVDTIVLTPKRAVTIAAGLCGAAYQVIPKDLP